MTQSKEIKEAKIKLFALLLDCQNDTLFDNEVDILYHLSIDRDIKEFLMKASEVKSNTHHK